MHGAARLSKEAAATLFGIAAPDWSSYTFTMNWSFMPAHRKIRSEPDDPFCHVVPIHRGPREGISSSVRTRLERPSLKREYGASHEAAALQHKPCQSGIRGRAGLVAEGIFARLNAFGHAGTRRTP